MNAGVNESGSAIGMNVGANGSGKIWEFCGGGLGLSSLLRFASEFAGVETIEFNGAGSDVLGGSDERTQGIAFATVFINVMARRQ